MSVLDVCVMEHRRPPEPTDPPEIVREDIGGQYVIDRKARRPAAFPGAVLCLKHHNSLVELILDTPQMVAHLRSCVPKSGQHSEEEAARRKGEPPAPANTSPLTASDDEIRLLHVWTGELCAAIGMSAPDTEGLWTRERAGYHEVLGARRDHERIALQLSRFLAGLSDQIVQQEWAGDMLAQFSEYRSEHENNWRRKERPVVVKGYKCVTCGKSDLLFLPPAGFEEPHLVRCPRCRAVVERSDYARIATVLAHQAG